MFIRILWWKHNAQSCWAELLGVLGLVKHCSVHREDANAAISGQRQPCEHILPQTAMNLQTRCLVHSRKQHADLC